MGGGDMRFSFRDRFAEWLLELALWIASERYCAWYANAIIERYEAEPERVRELIRRSL